MKKYLLLLLIVVPAQAQSITGSTLSITNGGTWTSGDYTMNADTLTSPRIFTIQKSKTCNLVVLEDSYEKIVIGCRKEFK